MSESMTGENQNRTDPGPIEYSIIIGILVLTGLYLVHFVFKPIAFDSAAWKAGTPAVRHRMVDDLLTKTGGLKGMTREEVLTLLGKPDHESAEKNYLRYVTEYFMALNIKLDPAGKVIDAQFSD